MGSGARLDASEREPGRFWEERAEPYCSETRLLLLLCSLGKRAVLDLNHRAQCPLPNAPASPSHEAREPVFFSKSFFFF